MPGWGWRVALGNGRSEPPAPPAALHTHKVFKNNKVLFKGSSHPIFTATLWVPLLWPKVGQGPKVARTENSTPRDVSEKKMYGFIELKSRRDGVGLR